MYRFPGWTLRPFAHLGSFSFLPLLPVCVPVAAASFYGLTALKVSASTRVAPARFSANGAATWLIPKHSATRIPLIPAPTGPVVESVPLHVPVPSVSVHISTLLLISLVAIFHVVSLTVVPLIPLLIPVVASSVVSIAHVTTSIMGPHLATS